MRVRLVLVRAVMAASVGLALTGSCASSLSASGPPAAAPGRLEVMHLRSPDGAPHDVWVYRPGVPDTDRLPVLYFLHGTPGAPADVFNAGLLAAVQAAVAAGAPPMVIAAPDGNGTRHPDSEWADATDGSDQLESFVVNTVVPAVEGTHRRGPAERAIAGFSMGGYGAVNLAVHHPDLFGQVVSIAGYFHVDDPDGVFGSDARARRANTPLAHLDALAHLRLLVLDGAGDTEPAVRGEAARLRAALAARHLPAEVRIGPGDHSWSYVKTQMPDVLSFLAAGFPPIRARPGSGRPGGITGAGQLSGLVN